MPKTGSGRRVVLGGHPAGQAALVPQTGLFPPRPAQFRYNFGTNVCQWTADTNTTRTARYVVQYAASPANSDDKAATAWTALAGSPVTNTGTGTMSISLSDLVSDRWFRIWGESATNLRGLVAGPIENSRPARVCRVKGYLEKIAELENAALVPADGVSVEFYPNTTTELLTLAGHHQLVNGPIFAALEEETGFFEAILPQSEEFTPTAIRFAVKVKFGNTVKQLPTTGDIPLATGYTIPATEEAWFNELIAS